ncbi:MAG TPA: metallopeptidase family protein [Verrucomicrobiota bacterium]|nr:metallopeptidase family protein [Verrucomicrobiota bacterium]HRZ35804.1 metallopeptidase family protein [Candidatus Paceibacterota bacterium]HRZ55100.1 metallopeptidase family protein [Candidatus Paceibacterota bacterium]
MALEFKQLRALAQSEVRATIAHLPARLRRHAERLPVTYEPRPNRAIVSDGFDPDLLGLFVGIPFGEEESGAIDVPAQIILFLESLWEFSEEEEEVFRDEVVTTYLHELGHYLGLDEIDIEERGLE